MNEERNWHALEVEEVFDELETSRKGLSNAEVEERFEKYGPNELREEEGVSKIELLFSQLKNPLVVVLFIASFISIGIGELVEALFIGVVIVFNTGIGFFQEYKAETAIKALKSLAAPEALVFRECEDLRSCIETRVKARELVPGDIIHLEVGDRVPADTRIFDAKNLEVDESMLTGESTTVSKTVDQISETTSVADRGNMAFAGTVVTQGRGRGVVVATGMKSEMGKISQLIEETEKVETPIQKRTADLSRKLMLIAFAASITTFTIGVLRGLELFEMFQFALVSAISAIPEGLPAVVTITLAVGVNRMAERNAIIRKLQAVDTLGTVTVICSDKTGTLTTNQMTVKKIRVNQDIVTVIGVGYEPKGQFKINDEVIEVDEHESLSLILRIGALCNDSKLVREEEEGDTPWKIMGDPTEGALIVAAAKADLVKNELEDDFPRVDEIPFSSDRRYMATFHDSIEGKLRVYVKGAPETVLELCSEVIYEEDVKKLTSDVKEEILKNNSNMAGEGLRVLAMAYREIEKEKLEEYKRDLQEDGSKLVFVGLVGMIDPPRDEVKDAIERCKRAGIKVIMSTGDHRLTAEAIAKEIGILSESGEVITGEELGDMSDDKLEDALENVVVFARVSPKQKHRIVESLRKKGHIVAMTGDGVNDAPALKASEIGISMGITGTDVTKESSDMVLVDDNFASIVNAIEEGRVVFENIKKVVKYLIITNVAEILTIITAMILLAEAPLIFTPIQILWVNLVTDGVLDVTLAMEPKEEDVMNHPPRDASESIIEQHILRNIIFNGAIMMTGVLWIFLREWNSGDIIRARTLGFTTLALFQVWSSLNCRSRTKSVFTLGLLTNKYLIVAIVVSIFLQFLATVNPYLQFALDTTTLSALDWATMFLITSSVFIAEEIRKRLMEK